MWAATVLGLLIGIMITWQTLRGAILANIKEFASLRALGVSMGSLRCIVMELSFWVGIAGLVGDGPHHGADRFSPASAACRWAFCRLDHHCAILLMIIALASGFFSLGVLKKSQPADLLR